MSIMCPELKNTWGSRRRAAWFALAANRFEFEFGLPLLSVLRFKKIKDTVNRHCEVGDGPTHVALSLGVDLHLEMPRFVGTEAAADHNARIIEAIKFIDSSNGWTFSGRGATQKGSELKFYGNNSWVLSRLGAIEKRSEDGRYRVNISANGSGSVQFVRSPADNDEIGIVDTFDDAVRLCEEHAAENKLNGPRI